MNELAVADVDSHMSDITAAVREADDVARLKLTAIDSIAVLGLIFCSSIGSDSVKPENVFYESGAVKTGRIRAAVYVGITHVLNCGVCNLLTLRG